LLNSNKHDNTRLKAAITYQDEYNCTSLHEIISYISPLDVIQNFIEIAPEVLKMKTRDGQLPIHYASQNEASLEVVQGLVNAHPESVKDTDNDGSLPLHVACIHKTSPDVLNFLIESYPEGMNQEDEDGDTPLDCLNKNGETPLDCYLNEEEFAEKDDHDGMLPLHHACKNGYSDHLIRFLIQAYPKGIKTKDVFDMIPFDYYTSFQGKPRNDKIIALLKGEVRTFTQQHQIDMNTQNVDEMKTEMVGMKEELVSLKADIGEIKSDIVEMKRLLRSNVGG